MSATILAIANQKGGVGKTTTTANLGIGLARTGKRVLLIDADPQASLTISLGYANPDDFPVTLTQLLQVTAQIGAPRPGEGILHHAEGVDLLPSNIELCSMEMTLINVLSRETTMKRLLEPMKKQYDYILIDCMPSLGQLTINALAAADSVIIPVQAQYLSLKGLEQLYDTCRKIRTQINPDLKIEGILPTMVDNRTNYAREVTAKLRENYGSGMKVFQTEIPHSVRAAEISAEGKSFFAHDPKGKVAAAYEQFTREVLAVEKQRAKNAVGLAR